MLGPLATYAEPHAYDLCEPHSERLSAPRGWEVMRLAQDPRSLEPTSDDLLALADAVREAARPPRSARPSVPSTSRARTTAAAAPVAATCARSPPTDGRPARGTRLPRMPDDQHTTGAENLDAVFKAYDVRGLVGDQIDESLARAVGAAFVAGPGARRLVVGHDMRESSPSLAGAFGGGATEAGADVVMIGLASHRPALLRLRPPRASRGDFHRQPATPRRTTGPSVAGPVSPRSARVQARRDP